MRYGLIIFFLTICFRSFSQTQTCPANIDFAAGNLTHWYAYTGNNGFGNGPEAIMQRYDSNASFPTGTRGAVQLTEYNLSSMVGIRVNSTNGIDPFGGFAIIPTINGYTYNYSIQLGSTAITRGNGFNGSGGGYIRGVSYKIRVPRDQPPNPIP